MLLMLVALWCPGPVAAYLDLATASVDRLENGLTVIVLEDSSFPVVSVQMLYRSGAVDEVSGKTGLAHFLEHMAFRDSENFPETGLVSSIYAVGGEWHGYTWLDQTTYFATVPNTQLDLLLRIEADRMARLKIPAAMVEAEAGAILAEMHGYENNPATVLQDYVLYSLFLAHPYRNNTIGWESDVLGITHADLVRFYQQHYRPGNAVLAVVGDIRKDEVIQQVRKLFGPLPDSPSPAARYTPEPVQKGERRVLIHGALDRKYFKIAYRAPSVSNPDFAAFLLTQELLSAGSGISFLQNDWGTPARTGSALAGVTDDLSTWFPPSEQDYVFTINGSIPENGIEAEIESAIETGIDGLRERFREDDGEAQESLEQARSRVFRELTFDVQTTEDAAHQLAFFAGLGALDIFKALPDALNAVSPADISRVLDQYLVRRQSVTGWYLPSSGEDQDIIHPKPVQTLVSAKPGVQSSQAPAEPASPAMLSYLENGTPVIVKRSTASPTVSIRVVVPQADYSLPANVSSGVPAWGLISLDFDLLPGEVGPAIDQAREIMDSARPLSAPRTPDEVDRDVLFDSQVEDVLGLRQPVGVEPTGPLLLVVSGDVEPEGVLQQLEAAFDDLPAGAWQVPGIAEPGQPVEIEARVAHPIAQERIGYVVRVPQPRPESAAAWQVALYVLSHGYEGRLGKQAISQQGLVYYIDSEYQTDGGNDWISLSMGVDPGKLPAVKRLLKEELVRLREDPPSEAEIEEAKDHLLGRHLSAYQSNAELVDSLTRQWIWYRDVLEYEQWQQQLAAVQRQDVLDLLPAFTRGSIIVVRNPQE